MTRSLVLSIRRPERGGGDGFLLLLVGISYVGRDDGTSVIGGDAARGAIKLYKSSSSTRCRVISEGDDSSGDDGDGGGSSPKKSDSPLGNDFGNHDDVRSETPDCGLNEDDFRFNILDEDRRAARNALCESREFFKLREDDVMVFRGVVVEEESMLLFFPPMAGDKEERGRRRLCEDL